MRRAPKPPPAFRTAKPVRVPMILTELPEKKPEERPPASMSLADVKGMLLHRLSHPLPPATDGETAPAPPPWMLPVPTGEWFKWSQEKQDQIVKFILETGCSVSAAARLAGVHGNYALAWMRRAKEEIASGERYDETIYYHQFHTAVEIALARLQTRSTTIISNEPDWHSQAWLLTHHPSLRSQWKPAPAAAKVQVSGSTEVTVHHEIAARAAELPPERLAMETERFGGLLDMFENEEGVFETP